MKDGNIYLFDTKSAVSDIFAANKHNVLISYIKENTTAEQPLCGGVITRQDSNWLYSTRQIENTTNTLEWIAFYPSEC